jgi:hypothetical protein
VLVIISKNHLLNNSENAKIGTRRILVRDFWMPERLLFASKRACTAVYAKASSLKQLTPATIRRLRRRPAASLDSLAFFE